jgi:RNA polymerase sigma-70 factor (ECF subfamily)
MDSVDTYELVSRAVQGDSDAANELFSLYEARLRRMVAFRLDKRLTARIDPSDVVQDAMGEAHRRLAEYVDQQEVPFYPWLRAIAWNKLIDTYRRHVLAERRSVGREVVQLYLSSESKIMLVNRLAAGSTSISEAFMRQELNERLRQAIDQLSTSDRELITLKHLEDMTFEEIAAVLQLSNEAVRSRYRRAIQRLHNLLHSKEEKR